MKVEAPGRRRFIERGATIGAAIALGAGGRLAAAQALQDCGPAHTRHRLPFSADVHTHIFNGRDLPVAAFLTRIVAPEHSGGGLIRRFAPILERMVDKLAPSAEREIGELEKLLTRQKSTALDLEALTADDATAADRAYAGELARELSGDPEFRNDYLRDLEARAERSREAGGPAVQRLNTEIRLLLATGKLSEKDTASLLDIEAQIAGPQLLSWGKKFTRYRYLNARELLLSYRTFNAAVLLGSAGCSLGAVDLFLPALVDFDFWLLDAGAKRRSTRMEEQIRVMEKIVRFSGGRVHPFAAFDPWRNFKESGRPLALVQDAAKRGFLGVKIYPPMGFAPYFNVARRPPSQWSGGDFGQFAASLDASMEGLLRFCESEGFPVLAHANRSNGPSAELEDLAGPDYWDKALSKFPALNVCFGHFGGEEGLWGTRPSADWQKGFVNLMRRHERAFTDTSYFAGVLRAPERKRIAHGLKVVFQSGGDGIASRMLYGSDWLMLAMEQNSSRYYEHFREVIREIEGSGGGLSARFFGGNALQFLNLAGKGSNYKRLEIYYAGNKMSPPKWFSAL